MHSQWRMIEECDYWFQMPLFREFLTLSFKWLSNVTWYLFASFRLVSLFFFRVYSTEKWITKKHPWYKFEMKNTVVKWILALQN